MSVGHSVFRLPMPNLKNCLLTGFCALGIGAASLAMPAHARPFIGYTGKTWADDHGVLRGQCNASNPVDASSVQPGLQNMATVELTPAFLAIFEGKADSATSHALDALCFGHTLELVPSGQAVRWRNPASGAGVYLAPGAKTDTCRTYLGVIVSNGEKNKFRGEACSEQAGQWRIQE
ncbi:RT0821/Lpp0805 family surface protein [Limnobacter sp.]|uniref:RT0821/Lpp0805 family surface protein n=1 Tax=Limnobacter sp. TaxID=2003368 RepID=UPI0035121C63